jgi:hypothetical protein
VSTYTDRVGQRIGSWVVEADLGRSKRGRVIWRLRDRDGRVIHLHTYALVRLARQHDSPAPPIAEEEA